jgi:hypothetical protein
MTTNAARSTSGVASLIGGVLIAVLMGSTALFVWWATANSENPGLLVFSPILLGILALLGVAMAISGFVNLVKTPTN